MRPLHRYLQDVRLQTTREAGGAKAGVTRRASGVPVNKRQLHLAKHNVGHMLGTQRDQASVQLQTPQQRLQPLYRDPEDVRLQKRVHFTCGHDKGDNRAGDASANGRYRLQNTCLWNHTGESIAIWCKGANSAPRHVHQQSQLTGL